MIEIVAQEPLVHIRFTATDGAVTLSDAINLTLEQHAALKPGDVELMAELRFDNHRQFVSEQSTKEAPPPTADELQAQLDQIVIDKAQLDVLEAELTAKLAEG